MGPNDRDEARRAKRVQHETEPESRRRLRHACSALGSCGEFFFQHLSDNYQGILSFVGGAATVLKVRMTLRPHRSVAIGEVRILSVIREAKHPLPPPGDDFPTPKGHVNEPVLINGDVLLHQPLREMGNVLKVIR